MYIKEYGKEFKIKNQILLFIAALLIGTAVYYLLPTGKQYAEIIYNLKIVEEKLNKKVLKLIRYISNNTLVIYLLASITDMMVYARLKEIFPDVTTRLRYAIPASILIFVITLVMSYIYNIILKGLKHVITGRKVEKI